MSTFKKNEIILNEIINEMEESISRLNKVQPCKGLSVEVIQKWKNQLLIRKLTVEQEKNS